jgi:hypothetical protein
VNEKLAVTLHESTSSKVVSTLQAHQHFTLLKVAIFDQRIRGKIQEPVGWISLKNTVTGHIFAHKAMVLPATGRKYAELPSFKGVEDYRTRDLAISFVCGLCSVLFVVLTVRRFAPCQLPSLSSPCGDYYRGSESVAAASEEERRMLLRH